MDGTYGWRGSVVLFIDQFLGYAGLRTVRKLHAGKFRVPGKEHINNTQIHEAILANARTTYVNHYETIRRIVPAERLLNYRLGSGWKPMCDFLKRKEPEEKFPWVNEAAALEKTMNGVVLERLQEIGTRLLWPIIGLLVLVLAAGLAVTRL